MAVLPDVVQVAGEVFRPLYGVPGWNVKKGHGSFLTFEFGAPHLHIREPRDPGEAFSARVRESLNRRNIFVHGDWHLWIYCCSWVVSMRGQRIAESESDDSTIDAAAHQLDGQSLVSVTGNRDKRSWTFVFDLGGMLETWPYGSGWDAATVQWYLYQPDGMVLSVGADGTYKHELGSDP